MRNGADAKRSGRAKAPTRVDFGEYGAKVYGASEKVNGAEMKRSGGAKRPHGAIWGDTERRDIERKSTEWR